MNVQRRSGGASETRVCRDVIRIDHVAFVTPRRPVSASGSAQIASDVVFASDKPSSAVGRNRFGIWANEMGSFVIEAERIRYPKKY
jgi:hypothetical protein